MNNDPYSILGVQRTASQDEIRDAYRKLAKENHPDLNPGNKQAEQRFKDVAAAYELIGDEKKRRAYDEGKAQEEAMRAQQNANARHFYYETQGPDFESGYSQGFSFEDLFGDAFRRGAGARRGPGQGMGPIPGQDEQYRMDIDLADIVRGAEREITLPSGKRLRVKIPPGVSDGSRLRFAGQGGPGVQGGPAGDAYVVLTVRPNPVFHRDGINLEMELPITLNEAINGGSVRVPTLDGDVMLNIPPGVSSGARLRVRGKGIPNRSQPGTRGDLYARMKIALPPVVGEDLKKAVTENEKQHPYDPRADLATKAA